MGETTYEQVLAGQRLALPESRRLDIFAEMLSKRGARVTRCPLVAIHDAPDPAPVEAWLRELIADRFDDVLLYTGEGLRRLRGFAERAGLHDAFVQAMGRTRKITRGPKPVKALREIGLRPNVQASAPTTDGVIATLRGLDLTGRVIGVQLYGQKRNEPLEQAIADAGARYRPVHPYVYASQAEDAHVARLIRELAVGEIEIIAFTASAQVDRLWQVAKAYDLQRALEQGLSRVLIAAVGPVAGEALRQRGLRIDAMPDEPFALKPLMHAIVEATQRAAAE